jgi:hypothetical protein
MNITFCSVVLSLIQGIALNTDVPPCPQGWGVTHTLLLVLLKGLLILLMSCIEGYFDGRLQFHKQ